MNDTLFSRRLRFAREAFGISQKHLGRLIGLNDSAAASRINRYERSARMPTPGTSEEIAHVLKISPSFFCEPDDMLAKIIFIIGKTENVSLKNKVYEMISEKR